MGEFTDEEKFHYYMGIEMNIQTWNLLGKENQDEKDNVRMINFAKSSLYHWKKSPKFELANEQRGQWMISHVYAVLGKGEKVLETAKEAMHLTEKHRFKDFDLAYAYEDGNIEAVNEYVMRDVEVTHQLFEKLRQYIK